MASLEERQKHAEPGTSPHSALPVWVQASPNFYKKLSRIASQTRLSPYEVLDRGMDALLQDSQRRRSALNKVVKNGVQSDSFRLTMAQLARQYWATIDADEKRVKAQRLARARWDKQKS